MILPWEKMDFPLNTGRKGCPDFKASRPINSWIGQENARIFG
jgi:hypothetical protein